MYETWNERFEIAKKYYEYHGNLQVKSDFKTIDGITYNEEGLHLGRWINRQRSQYKIGQLTLEHKQKLESIGMIFENVNDLQWNAFYEKIYSYLIHYHNLYIPNNFKTKDGITYDENGKNLDAWWRIQRLNYNKGTLSEERIKKIDKLYEYLAKYEKSEWNKMYELARKYYEKYNHLIIKQKNILIDENNQAIDLVSLGTWIKKQRRDYKGKKLNQEQIKKLEEIGMVFENIVETEWERMYGLALIYFKHYGNLKMSRKFKTKDGITYDECGSALGKWLNAQYSNNLIGTLSIERKQRLEAIGMHFTNESSKFWNEMLGLCVVYLNNYGNLDIPVNFKTKDGITYDEDGKQLGQWLIRQKVAGIRGTLSLEHRQKLDSIGLKFELYHDKEWKKMYSLAKIYYEKYKTLDIPVDFRTKDGVTYDEEGSSVGSWIYKQQSYYNSNLLTDERKMKLEQLGMNNENSHEGKWEKMYNLAKNYYLKHLHLKVKIGFKTTDGYTYDENGESLGNWISTQKTNYKSGKLSQIRIEKLQLIGIVFEPSKNKEKNQYICTVYDIDYKKYKRQIDIIPYTEFLAKVNYLNQNALPFVIDKQLHPIFFTSSINMEVKYGLSLEQMINDYHNQVEKSKQMVKMIKMGV